uniref:Uncharacterized protein n=1 Tax=Anguilla anguilla TaxID=7936 RepID=A0A0E9R1L7_ANGAN
MFINYFALLLDPEKPNFYPGQCMMEETLQNASHLLISLEGSWLCSVSLTVWTCPDEQMHSGRPQRLIEADARVSTPDTRRA